MVWSRLDAEGLGLDVSPPFLLEKWRVVSEDGPGLWVEQSHGLSPSPRARPPRVLIIPGPLESRVCESLFPMGWPLHHGCGAVVMEWEDVGPLREHAVRTREVQ